MNRALTEHVARGLLYRVERRTLPPASEMTDEDRGVLASYMERAEAALKAVRCDLMGAQCTCWTLDSVAAADLRLFAARRAAA